MPCIVEAASVGTTPLPRGRIRSDARSGRCQRGLDRTCATCGWGHPHTRRAVHTASSVGKRRCLRVSSRPHVHGMGCGPITLVRMGTYQPWDRASRIPASPAHQPRCSTLITGRPACPFGRRLPYRPVPRQSNHKGSVPPCTNAPTTRNILYARGLRIRAPCIVPANPSATH